MAEKAIVELDHRGSQRFKCPKCLGFMDIIGVTTVDGPRETEIICKCEHCRKMECFRYRWVGK